MVAKLGEGKKLRVVKKRQFSITGTFLQILHY